jgi:hypothetical protein
MIIVADLSKSLLDSEVRRGPQQQAGLEHLTIELTPA